MEDRESRRMSRPVKLLAAFCIAALMGAGPRPARAGEPVDVMLALVTDVSRSVDDSEFDLEKNGYQAAFNNAQVLNAIKSGPNGAIAVTYIEFASNYEVRTVVDWMVVKDAASADAFLARMMEAPRSYYGRTAIGSGIDLAVQAMSNARFDATRRVIDVCGDGTSNAGREVSQARDDAIAAGITINGLAIINEHPASWTYAHVQPPGGLGKYYRENVTGGPASFVLEIHDFHDFGEAITRKLINEIAAVPPQSRLAAAASPAQH
jgi:hypothetical protein